MRTIAIDWQDNPTEDNVSKYRVEMRDSGSGVWSSIYEGSVSAATLTGFPDGSTEIRISAFNGLWSEPSPSFVVPAAPPSVPDGLEVVYSTPEA